MPPLIKLMPLRSLAVECFSAVMRNKAQTAAEKLLKHKRFQLLAGTRPLVAAPGNNIPAGNPTFNCKLSERWHQEGRTLLLNSTIFLSVCYFPYRGRGHNAYY